MNDIITLPRSVVEQALEALNASMPHDNDMDQDWPSHIAARRTLRAALAQPQVQSGGIPTNWKLVPVDPADFQIRAAQDTWWHACNCETYWDQIYAAMIAAAPQPPVVEQPQPLTIEQIARIDSATEWPEGSLRNIGPRDWRRLLVTATRAIERAHGIGGEV